MGETYFNVGQNRPYGLKSCILDYTNKMARLLPKVRMMISATGKHKSPLQLKTNLKAESDLVSKLYHACEARIMFQSCWILFVFLALQGERLACYNIIINATKCAGPEH
jgi:hypothetical protein